MNVVMLNVAVFMMLAVNLCHGQLANASSICDKLPKVKAASIQELTANSPYESDYTLTDMFKCSTKVFTNPARGSTNYNGSVIEISAIKGSPLITFEYAVRSDGITSDVTLCASGVKSVWYIAAYESGVNGSFICLYTCDGIPQFLCASNNNGTLPQEKQTVDNAKKAFLSQIQDAKENCELHTGCKVF